MFGIKFIKVQPTTYLLEYRAGKVVREGLGLSFFYYAPTTSLVAVLWPAPTRRSSSRKRRRTSKPSPSRAR